MNVSLKLLSILLIAVLAASIMLVSNFAVAQSATKPSVPEFNLQIVAHPFDIAPKTTIDPYTGQTSIIKSGSHIANVSIEIIIKNQPLYTINYSDKEGLFVWYQVHFKGAFQDDWRIFHYDSSITPFEVSKYNPQQIGDYTVISIPINSDDPLNTEGKKVGSTTNFPQNAQVDFQIRACIGSVHVTPNGGLFYGLNDAVQFNGDIGDWSSTQTINLSSQNSAVVSNLTPDQTDDQYQTSSINFSFSVGSISPFILAVLVGLIAILIGIVLVILRKKV